MTTWAELVRSLAALARSYRDALGRAGFDEVAADTAAQEIVCRWLAIRLGAESERPACLPALQNAPWPAAPALRRLLRRAGVLLARADREAILRDFHDCHPGADPAIHFYEHFLAEYDPHRRMRRGVFYTPRPVVQFIIRAVHERLRNEFGLADGLADTRSWGELFALPPGSPCRNTPFVQIIDLAAGTGAFLVETIDIIHRVMQAKWRAAGASEKQICDLWHEYVPGHLLPRLHGLELAPTACTLANFNLALKLRETGYTHAGELTVVRPGNSLELLTAAPDPRTPAPDMNLPPALTVVLGNPPYALRSGDTPSPMNALMADYKEGLAETNINALSDDYVRFLRLAHALIAQAGAGVIGVVTNNSFLEGVTHRRMRELLLRDFDCIEVLDLHGSVMRRAETPAGVTDQNVFHIQQGVAITLLSRLPNRPASSPRETGVTGSKREPALIGPGRSQPKTARMPAETPPGGRALVRRADLWGTREQKLQRLAAAASADAAGFRSAIGAAIDWRAVPCAGPYFLFRDTTGDDREYQRWTSLADIFEVFSCGIKFRKEGLLVKNHFTRQDVERMLEDVASLPDEALMDKYRFRETADWRLEDKRPLFAHWRLEDIIEVTYRPFDIRYAFYPLDRAARIIVRGDSRVGLMRHLLAMPNIGLLFNRQVVGQQVTHFLVSRRPVSHGAFYLGNKGQDYFAPLYLLDPDGRPRPNLKAEFIAKLAAACRPQTNKDAAPLPTPTSPSPEAVLHYLYAIVHSPTYRARYAEPLKLDFPRIPMPPSAEVFDKLAGLGADLVGLHLLDDAYPGASWSRSSRPGPFHTARCALAGDGPAVVAAGYPKYRNGRVYINATCWFEGVAAEVWTFQVGGYCVCPKWLQARRGRQLSADDIRHYGRIVAALGETRRLMDAIDAFIAAQDGFPAFQPASDREAESDQPA